MLGAYSEQPTEEFKLRKAQFLRARMLVEDIHQSIPFMRTRFAISDLPATDDPSDSRWSTEAD